MMILKEDIAQLKERMRIEDVVSKMGVTVTRVGARFRALCPFHDDHHPSLLLNPVGNSYYCPACGAKGDSINFVMKKDHLSYVEALQKIAGMYGMELREKNPANSEVERRKALLLEQIRIQRETIVEVAQKFLFMNDNDVHEYLTSRGLNDDTLHEFRIGYLPDESLWGVDTEVLAQSYEAKMMRNRIIFPWYSPANQICGLAGRVTDRRTKGLVMKYVNSSEGMGFRKGSNLWGLAQARRDIVNKGKVIIVEGYVDVMAMHQAGIGNTVALCGTALTDEHVRLLKRYADGVVLCLDNDAAGRNARDAAAEKLLLGGFRVEVLMAPEGCDPADMLVQQGEDGVREWAQSQTVDMLDMCIDDFMKVPVTDPYGRRTAFSRLQTFLSFIDDVVLRKFYIEKCIHMCPLLTLDDFKSE